MLNTSAIRIGNDAITRRTPTDWETQILVYEYLCAPRSDQYFCWFHHSCNDVLIYSLNGSLAFESNGVGTLNGNCNGNSTLFTIQKDNFIQVPAGAAYRFRSTLREPVRALIIVSSDCVEESWRSVASDLQKCSGVHSMKSLC